jgi:leader peptidase (prepilin peptidase)/N-methyltransferase
LATDLIPVVSYLVLRGRCRDCRSPIAGFNLIIELLGVAVALWAALLDRDPIWLWSTCILGWTLLAMAWIDAEHMRLPDILTLSLAAFGMALYAVVAPERLTESLVGALVGYASFQAIALIYRTFRGREGLGAGDAKLLAAAGIWVGWSGLPDVVLLAALLAILAVMVMRISGETTSETKAIPFGPFLATSFWLNYLYGPLFF